jgi:acyl-coenzyme A synthetase/AMP-(fatty) acid ligase
MIGHIESKAMKKPTGKLCTAEQKGGSVHTKHPSFVVLEEYEIDKLAARQHWDKRWKNGNLHRDTATKHADSSLLSLGRNFAVVN